MSLIALLEKHSLRALMRLPAPVIRALAGAPRRAGDQSFDPKAQLITRLARRDKMPDSPQALARARRIADSQAQYLPPAPTRAVTHQDITLPGGDGPRPARLYRPQGLGASAPVLLSFHGGGHVLGSITSHDGLCRMLADSADIAVISYDYRLAPEHPFPAGIEDAIAAYRGMVAAAPGLGLDPTRIALGGDSAGANCAAVVAQTCRADAPPPAAQLLLVPWVEMTATRPSRRDFGSGFMLSAAAMRWFTNTYLASADPNDPRAAPILGSPQGLPPAIILTAGCDPLRDEGEDYASLLRDAGVPVWHRRMAGLPHGAIAMARALPSARAALQDAAHELAARLHRKAPSP